MQTVVTALEDVQAAVDDAHRTGRSLRIRGSGYEAGLGYPVAASRILDTTGLVWIRDFDPDELVIRVGAGVTARSLNDRLSEHRLRAVIPATPGDRTIGGIIAAASSGYARLRYGPLRNHVIGATIVTGAGEVVSAGGQVVKNVTGYDLARLCVGSLGRLGVIVEVVLRVYARRGETQLIEVPDPQAAWRSADRPLAVIETRDRCLALVDGSPAAVDTLCRRLGATRRPELELPDGSRWRWRATLRTRPSRQTKLAESLPSDWEFIAQHGTGLTAVGGDRPDPAALLTIRQEVEQGGGRLVIHRWPEDAGPSPDPWGEPPPGLDLQRRLVESFDPAGILNPGILPGRI